MVMREKPAKGHTLRTANLASRTFQLPCLAPLSGSHALPEQVDDNVVPNYMFAGCLPELLRSIIYETEQQECPTLSPFFVTKITKFYR